MHGVEPELFSFRRCPYAIRARMALYASGQSFQITEVSLRAKPERLCTLSPKATVPVLVLTDGQVIDQSLDIMRWALSKSDPLGWLSRSGTAHSLDLLARNDGEFKHWLDRYKYPDRYPRECVGVAREKAMQALIHPLADLLKSQPYIGGCEASLEDVAIFPFIRQFSGVDPVWFASEVSPSVQGWLADWLRSPLFERVMRKPSVR